MFSQISGEKLGAGGALISEMLLEAMAAGAASGPERGLPGSGREKEDCQTPDRAALLSQG